MVKNRQGLFKKWINVERPTGEPAGLGDVPKGPVGLGDVKEGC